MTQSPSSNITNSKLCKYCNQVQIYWNSSKRVFVEVETGNKHFCVTRKDFNTIHNNIMNKPNISQGTSRPTYYSGTGKPLNLSQQSTKQQVKHSNSIKVLKGSEQQVQKQYETLADILAELGGGIHGSQSHYFNSELRIVVYYEVPSGENREEVKIKFENCINAGISS